MQRSSRLPKPLAEPDAPHHVYPHVPGYERLVLLENDGDRRPNTDVWHTDLTFKQNPPFASILYAKAIPACGGDTLWWSTYAAYEALPDGMKADLRDLAAVHATGSYWNQFFAQGGRALKEGMAAIGGSGASGRRPPPRDRQAVSLCQSPFHHAHVRDVQRR